MIESTLLASSGQVKTKDVLNEKWAWISELPFAQKGDTLGKMLTVIYQDLTVLKDENKSLKNDISNLKSQIDYQAQDIKILKNDITALKGLKVEL